VPVLTLSAPVAGWAASLEEVPDVAFAQRMVGDGIAIDPVSPEIVAPCDGVVMSVHRARHACVLRAVNGAEILLHVGVDTVGLGGEGFTAHIREGQQVKAGEPLLTFDMDRVARGARSLHTMMVVSNGEAFVIVDRAQDREVAAGEPVMSIQPVADDTAPIEAIAAAGNLVVEEEAERVVVLPIRNGLHARPAAAFVEHAKTFAGSVSVACNGRIANGKSVGSLMALGARHGDTLSLTVKGRGSKVTADHLVALVSSGLGDPLDLVTARPATKPLVNKEAPSSREPFAEGAEVLLKGVSASPGVAIGRAFRFEPESVEVAEDGSGTDVEAQRLATALASARGALEQAVATADADRDKARGEIFRAHLALLEDPELTERARALVAAGKSAGWAWRAALKDQAQALEATGNPLLQERVADLRDVERRVLAVLAGASGAPLTLELPDGAIVVAEDLLPSDLAVLPAAKLAAFCTANGGPTSHVAILAASMGVPAVVAAGASVLRIPHGASLIVDAGRGEVSVFPEPAKVAQVQHAMKARAARKEAARSDAATDCVTADGIRIEVCANLGRPGDASVAAANGAEGCGLLRSEFLFLDRPTAPDEDEQLSHYQAAADALGGRPVVIRTLDVGGDKPLAYLPLPHEENPVLGLRGVRVSLRMPDLLRQQIRAILRVRPFGICRILVPMVAGPEDIRAVRKIVDEEQQKLGLLGPVQIGAMIEVPAAAILADHIAAVADFLSIGTNDLTQYVLAMDRANPAMAPHLDALNPAVLRLIAQTVAGAARHGLPVAVCGGVASDPAAAGLLIGLGVTELSAAPAVIPELKAAIRQLTLEQCRALAQQAIAAETGDQVRSLIAAPWPDPQSATGRIDGGNE